MKKQPHSGQGTLELLYPIKVKAKPTVQHSVNFIGGSANGKTMVFDYLAPFFKIPVMDKISYLPATAEDIKPSAFSLKMENYVLKKYDSGWKYNFYYVFSGVS